MTLLVTGEAGFVGSNFVLDSLGNRPIEPRALEVEFFPMEEVLHELA